jgi:hypothetical protein
MVRNEYLHSVLKDQGFMINTDEAKKHQLLECRPGAMRRYVAELEGIKLHSANNGRELLDLLDTRRDPEFFGGSLRDVREHLDGRIDLAPLEKVKGQFSQTKLGARIKALSERLKMQRKRRMSERDGEWDMSRRWEVNPFQHATRERHPIKVVNFEAEFSLNCGVSAAEISKYGAMVWSIAQLIEEAGICVGIKYVKRTDRNFGGDWRQRVVIEVKKPGEYVTPSLIAAVTTGPFYRRAMLSLNILGADLNSADVAFGLGSSPSSKEAVKFENGSLFMTLDAMEGNAEKLEQELLKAIGLGPALPQQLVS